MDNQFALRTMVEGHPPTYASSIGSGNQLTDNHEPGSGWTTSSNNDTIIINKPASRDDESIIYNESTGDPYPNEIIYFVQNGKLLRRRLANSAATDNALTTSCPEAQASSSCPSDNELAEYVSDFSFTLYDTNHQQTTNPAIARAVRLNLTMERGAFGETVNITNSITTELRN
ncbi:MAG: hypothetical protein U5L95_05690 [Candidatus Saccharibacteria bacterium]|nr:hypothetical protein [Candidatus Saccharibacteria bacterium]